jgi:hypothetical protein
MYHTNTPEISGVFVEPKSLNQHLIGKLHYKDWIYGIRPIGSLN